MKRTTHPSTSGQLTMNLNSREIENLEATQRAEAVNLIAQLLLEACGVASEEDGDEDL